jgi:Asp-tRNA(Asn)/Glu-tRNA(Gln) amidotransferase A subunit family amidase
MANLNETRRRFLAHFASVGLGSTLAPGILWARMQDAGAKKLTVEMVADAMKLSGLDFNEADLKSMVDAANQNLARYEELRTVHIPNDVSPPFHFSSLVPGIEVNRTKLPFRLSAAPAVKRPVNLEEAAFWPVRHLAELIRTRQVTSVELTEMYLARLHRYNAKLNNVVTFLDDLGRAEAKRADADIAAGKYKGPLHGIPWGAKDIIAVKGYKTTWGSPAFKEQAFDYDASVVELLRDAGAVLIAKVTTGELASGDQWFGGQTKSPWNLSQGSSGSSAGPSSATAAGCIGFGIGSETSGSILSPAARCGLAGLRPTFGRVSRHGVMALSWTQDRLGPLCRYAEDCAIVMQAIAKPDGRDMSVSDIPFNWNAQLDVKKLRVGIIQESFDELTNADAKRNAAHTLDTLRSIGVSKFVPVTVPETPFSLNAISAIGVESAVFFDEPARSGRMKEARGGGRYNGRLVPAVEYLKLQRARMMMMMKLAEATANVDVYVVASNNTGVGEGGRGGGRGRGADAPGTTTPDSPAAPAATASEPPRPQGPTQRHFTMANLACYPAVNVPNGFTGSGSPTNAVFYARPFGEMEALALAKAYQDAAGFYLKRPTALDS